MIIRLIIRVILALSIGLAVSARLAGRDPRIHKALEEYLRVRLETMLECKLEGKIVGINVFRPTMLVENAGACSYTPNEWQWRAKQCTFTFSYLELITTKKVAVNVHIDGAVASSLYNNGKLPLTNHLEKLVAVPEDFPLGLKKLLATNAKITLQTPANDTSCMLDFKTEASTVGTQFRATTYVTNGAVMIKNRSVAQSLVGNLTAEISRDKNHPGFTGLVDVSLVLPQLPTEDQHCSLRAQWKDNHGTLTLSNKKETCVIHHADIILTTSGTFQADVQAQFPLSYGSALYNGDKPGIDMRGACTVQAKILDLGIATQQVDSTVSVAHCGWRAVNIERVDAHITAQGAQWHAQVQFHDPLYDLIEGTVNWDHKKQRGQATLENGSRLEYAPFKYWHVLAHGIHVDAQFDDQGALKGAINATAHHEKLGTQAVIVGQLKVDQEQFLLKGSVNDKPYVVDIALTPHILLNNILITDQKGQQLIAIKAGISPHTLFEGTVTFPFLRTVIMSSTGYDMRGQGDIKVKTALKGNKLYGQLVLPEGNIRLGTTYNYMQEALVPLEVDLEHRRGALMGAHIKLHKGSVRCQRATFEYNQQGQITFAHVPLLFNKLFLNVGKDMFVIVSGYVVLTYRKDHVPLIQGTLSVDRAQVKQNILSGNVQGSLLKELSSALIGSSCDVAFDIRLINRHPLQVRTNVLHTDLDMQLRCTGSLSAPRVEGSINLTHGTLQFPYRPLNIVSGMLHFEPHQPDDPRIELTAKGNIKRYTVTMQVGGTVRTPTFNFSSSPSLDEEQIITLLLAGSEAGSLSLVMPSLIMQNVQNYIFGSDHGSSTVETYVNNVLAPFKHIRIVPSFSDQTARGGFRGAIEIDVSERLHATIQKNFSLTEDTRVELEFRVSDDINVRGIKDERGDLGGELETRFSF